MKKSKKTKGISFKAGGSMSRLFTQPGIFSQKSVPTVTFDEDKVIPSYKNITEYLMGEKRITKKKLFDYCMEINDNNKIKALAWVHKISESRKLYDFAKGIKRKKK